MSEVDAESIKVERVFVRVRSCNGSSEVKGIIERAELEITDDSLKADILFVDKVSLTCTPLLRQQVINAAKPGGMRVVALCRGRHEEHYPLALELTKYFNAISRTLRENLAEEVRISLGVQAA